MLSRTADNLYWMGRYMERAENTARILDVSYRSALLPQPMQRPNSEWQAALAILGDPAELDAHEEDDEPALISYLVLDTENPSSIVSSIRMARENARSLRASISTETWETLNATWLEVRELDFARLDQRGFREFFDWIKDRSHLFQGVTNGTMMHDEQMWFARLGTMIERANSTARLLAAKYHILSASGAPAGGAVDYYQWGAVLRAVSAFSAYHQTYSDVITAARVAELLVLKPEMPRSLRFCYDTITGLLTELAGGRNLECQRRAGELHARLRFGRIEEILRRGLHPFLIEYIEATAELSDSIARDFMMA